MKLIKYIYISLILVPVLCFAHGPSRQKVVKEIEIDASPEKVWSLIADFCAIREWNPVITDCASDNGNQPDSIRTITLENGEQLKEKLIKHLPEQMKYQYMMVEPNTDALPINTHGSSISVSGNDNGGSLFIVHFRDPTRRRNSVMKPGMKKWETCMRAG